VSEGDRPETVDRDRPAVALSELSFVDPLAAAVVLVGADPAVPEVPDEHVAGERPEARRCERKPPRSVRRCVLPSAGGDARHELPVRGELVDVAEPAAGDVVMLGGVL